MRSFYHAAADVDPGHTYVVTPTATRAALSDDITLLGIRAGIDVVRAWG